MFSPVRGERVLRPRYSIGSLGLPSLVLGFSLAGSECLQFFKVLVICSSVIVRMEKKFRAKFFLAVWLSIKVGKLERVALQFGSALELSI